MNTKQLLKIVEDRGLQIVLKEGRPVITKPLGSTALTDKLLAVLKVHRERIIEFLSHS